MRLKLYSYSTTEIHFHNQPGFWMFQFLWVGGHYWKRT
jgi:hypothetical protein